jgi:hypothetical protein
MSLWKKHLGKQPEETHECNECGQTLDARVSGQVAKFLDLDWWPCPKCKLYAEIVVVSDRGIVAERPPLLVTVRRDSGGDFEVLVGVGSIASPATRTLSKNVRSGRDALFAIIDSLDPKNELVIVDALK